jgi:hypothetical protein
MLVPRVVRVMSSPNGVTATPSLPGGPVGDDQRIAGPIVTAGAPRRSDQKQFARPIQFSVQIDPLPFDEEAQRSGCSAPPGQ